MYPIQRNASLNCCALIARSILTSSNDSILLNSFENVFKNCKHFSRRCRCLSLVNVGLFADGSPHLKEKWENIYKIFNCK